MFPDAGKRPVEKGTGARLIEEWEKMSKSKYNGVDPKVAAYTQFCSLLLLLCFASFTRLFMSIL